MVRSKPCGRIFYDGLMGQTTPVYGSVDKKAQRAAWSIGDKKDRVFEAGIANLTKDQTPVLIHMGKDKTQQLLLVARAAGHAGLFRQVVATA